MDIKLLINSLPFFPSISAGRQLLSLVCYYAQFVSTTLPCPPLERDYHLSAQSLPITTLSPVQDGLYKVSPQKSIKYEYSYAYIRLKNIYQRIV